jgi:hypothetical protein
MLRCEALQETLAISEWMPSVPWTKQENCHDTKGSNRHAD